MSCFSNEFLVKSLGIFYIMKYRSINPFFSFLFFLERPYESRLEGGTQMDVPLTLSREGSLYSVD